MMIFSRALLTGTEGSLGVTLDKKGEFPLNFDFKKNILIVSSHGYVPNHLFDYIQKFHNAIIV